MNITLSILMEILKAHPTVVCKPNTKLGLESLQPNQVHRIGTLEGKDFCADVYSNGSLNPQYGTVPHRLATSIQTYKQ